MSAQPRARRPHVGPLLSLPTWLVLGGFLVAPLAIMLAISFARRAPYGGTGRVDNWWAHLASGEAFANYLRSLDPTYLQIHLRSLMLALATTALCLLVGYPIAYWVARLAPARWKGVLLALLVIPFWTSFLVRTYAWMLILRSGGLANLLLLRMGIVDAPLPLLYNDFAVLVGLVYGELPFMVLPLYAALERLDGSLLEAGRDLGAGRLSTLLRITVPLTLPGILAGVVLVFIPALGQFVVSDLLGGARTVLLGNLIQNQFTVARNPPFGAALATELTLRVLLLLWAYAAWARRRGQEALP
jgi:spermidine/putrescine transport system permease protein